MSSLWFLSGFIRALYGLRGLGPSPASQAVGLLVLPMVAFASEAELHATSEALRCRGYKGFVYLDPKSM